MKIIFKIEALELRALHAQNLYKENFFQKISGKLQGSVDKMKKIC